MTGENDLLLSKLQEVIAKQTVVIEQLRSKLEQIKWIVDKKALSDAERTLQLIKIREIVEDGE